MERPKRTWFGGGLKSDAALPSVGPAFVSMDDAARYAHGKIGNRRDIEYGGVILENLADGYFYATEPLAGARNSFDPWTVLKVDSAGKYLHPEGYRCVADYHSHPDMFDEFEANNPTFSDRQVRALNSFFSDIDLAINILERGFFTASYLSNPDGSLFKHVTTGSEAERRFGVWLDQKLPFNHADGPLGDKPEDLIKKTARVSLLAIVVPSSLWGGTVGTIPAQWQPYSGFVSRTYELPACGPVHSGLETALAALAQRSPQATQPTFILKHIDKEDYVLTEPLTGGSQSVHIQQLFPLTPDGQRVVHDHFHWDGVYLERPPPPIRQAVQEPWLYRNFFTPLELATQLYQARQAYDLLGPRRHLVVYRNLNDGALLQYTCSFSAAEATLFQVQADGQVVDNQIDSALLAGGLSPTAFVLRVAAAGLLSVRRAGKIWDKSGPVDAQWQAFSLIAKPLLSPAFISADDAARWAHNRIGKRRDKEYGGAVLKKDGRYFATEPLAGASTLIDFRTLMATDEYDYFIAPSSYSCQAFYHSHPAVENEATQQHAQYSADEVSLTLSYFSAADLAFAIGNRDFAPAHYLSGSQDSLLKYTSSGSAQEQRLLKQLMGELDIEPFNDFEGAIWMLASAGDLRVVLANRVWGGVRGRVLRGWTLGSPVSPAGTVQEQPFFTPVVSQGDVAVLIALNHQPLLPVGAYQGFVLKHQTTSAYIATLPVAEGTTLASQFPARTDGQPKLPSNFRLVGLYYRGTALPVARLPSKEAWLYQRFTTPQVLVSVMNLALATLRIQIAALGVKLYLHTADKALLHWQVPTIEASTELFTVGEDQLAKDKGNWPALMSGSLATREFIRRVARAGELSVIQPGPLWATRGRVYDKERLPLGIGVADLGPLFLGIDDAARYAHEQIGVRRGVSYGGYILRRGDGRFTLTLPLSIHGNAFVDDLLYAYEKSALLVPPADHVIVARYASHPALSQEDLGRRARLDWTSTDLEVSATMFSDTEIAAVIGSGLPAYLSGSPSHLISYSPSGSSVEQRVLNNTTRAPGANGYFQRLEERKLKPVDIVQRLAEAGHLQVQVCSRLWGPRLRVYTDWTPNFEYAEVVPQTPAFGAIFASAEEAALDAHRRWYGHNLNAQGYAAYLLKHPDKPEYVISELAAVDGARWLSDSSLDAGYLAGGDFAHGFVLAGMFHTRQWAPSGLTGAEAWLTYFLVTPQTLWRAEQDARYLSRPQTVGILPLYLSTLDGALLRYQPGESSLLNAPTEGEGVTVKGMEGNIHSGSFDPRRFVALLAQSDGLRVLYSSQCWGRRGVVSPRFMHWRPYAHLARRRMGPAFNDQDDAARYARSRLGNANGNDVMGGLILKRPDGLFVATEPLKVPREDFDTKWIFPDELVSVGGFPAVHTLVGRYRTSPLRELPFALDTRQKSLYRNMLSTRVISAALSTRDTWLTREYLFASDASVLSYTRVGSPLEAQLKTDLLPLDPLRQDLLDNKLERQIRAGTLTPLAFVTRLSKAGTLCVVEGSPLWGSPRTLAFEFIASVYHADPLLIRRAQADPAFTPVFAQEEDAVRHAHEHCVHGQHLQFGYVLKSQKNEHFIATLALVRQSYREFAQVFPQGLLPQGYTLAGFYLCGTLDVLAPADDPLGKVFFRPTDIDTAIRFSVHYMRGKTLPCYLSCTDGALLSYRYFGSDAQLDSLGRLQALSQQWRDGEARVLSYIHELGDKGDLAVLVQGQVWSGTNRIRRPWQPGTGDRVVELWPGCGPVFSHGDDAARDVQRRFSPFNGQEYLVAILANSARSSFIARLPFMAGIGNAQILRLFYSGAQGFAQPLENPKDDPIPFPDFPRQFFSVAAHILFGAMASSDMPGTTNQVLLNNFVAPQTLAYFVALLKAKQEPRVSLYLSCRAGALLKYIPSFSAMETAMMASAQDLAPSAYLKRVTEAGELWVLDWDSYWKREGRQVDIESENGNGPQTDIQIDEPLSIRDRDEL